MSFYRDLMSEHGTEFDFKDETEHITKVNIPNLPYPNQHINTEIPNGSKYHVIVPDIKITCNHAIESTDKPLLTMQVEHE